MVLAVPSQVIAAVFLNKMSFYLYLVLVFLLGGIPFGYLAGYLTGQGDIRKRGSGNIGSTNVWRVAGPVPGLAVLILDIGKGATAVLLCRFLYHVSWPLSSPTSALIGGVSAVLGHVFSPYLAFRGGKGVNTALGVFVSLMPLESAAALATFLLMMVLFRYVSLGSISGTIVLASTLLIERFVFARPIETPYLVVSLLLVFFILYTHRENVRRLLQGTESKFSFRKVSG